MLFLIHTTLRGLVNLKIKVTCMEECFQKIFISETGSPNVNVNDLASGWQFINYLISFQPHNLIDFISIIYLFTTYFYYV